MISNVTMNNAVTYTCYADGGPGNSYQWIQLRNNETVLMTQELTLDNTDPWMVVNIYVSSLMVLVMILQ